MDPLVTRLRAAGCVFAEDEAAALRDAARSPEELETMAVRRIAGEPLELVIGWAAFDRIRVRVATGVFVPRLRSTLMVRLAVALLRKDGPIGSVAVVAPRGDHAADVDRSVLRSPTVLDLGCGTGAIGAAIADRVTNAEVWAVDVDPDAVACARCNLPPQRVLLGDLFAPLPPDLRADVICANAPYVPTDAIALMPPEARDHEHRIALDGGPDGLSVQRRVIAEAPEWLAPGGALLVETSQHQVEATADLMRRSGLTPHIHTDEEIDGTVVSGTKGSSTPHRWTTPREDETSTGGSDDAAIPRNLTIGLDH